MFLEKNLENIIVKRPDKTLYRYENKLIKVFGESFRAADVLNEALNQARVEETGLPIPKLFEVTKINDNWAIVSEFIEGNSLYDLFKENPDKKDEYMDLLIDIQLKIHSKHCPLLTKIIDKMSRKIDEADVDHTIKYELQTRLKSQAKHNFVCHGDLCPSNIIISPSGAPFVIDWAHATQGNASADIARTFLLFTLQNDDNGETAARYMEKITLKSGISQRSIEKWLPIVACSQSVKKKSEERDFLMSWVNVVEYE